MELRVTRSALDAIARDAARASPAECCGLLIGSGDVIEQALPAPNVSPEPLARFEIDPQALVDAHRAARAGGPRVLGYYHSHPGGAAAPSAVDRAQASGDGKVWAIAGIGGVTFWRDEEAGFARLSYTALDR
jgi:proteasome lid subunit RPN8/RPN11